MLNWPADHIGFEEEVVFKSGHQLKAASLLFEKVEDEAIDLQIEKLAFKKRSSNSPGKNHRNNTCQSQY